MSDEETVTGEDGAAEESPAPVLRTVPCINEGCDQQVSRNANACPKCGTLQIPDRSHRPCRACDTALPRAEHRYAVRHGIFLSENHKPCPHCGEPQPLWTPMDTVLQAGKVTLLALAFLIAIAIMMVVSRNASEERRLFKGHDSLYRGANG